MAGAAARAAPSRSTARSASAAVRVSGGASRSDVARRWRSRAARGRAPPSSPPPAADALHDDAEQHAPAADAGDPAAGLEPLEAGDEPAPTPRASARGRRPAAPSAPRARRRSRAGCRRRCCRGCRARGACRPPRWRAARRSGKPPPSAFAHDMRSGVDALPLVRPHLPGPAHAGLDLVEAEQHALPPRQLARRLRGSPPARASRRDSPWIGSTMNAAVRRRRAPPRAPRRRRTGRGGRRGRAARSPCWYFCCPPTVTREERPAVEGVVAGDDLVPLGVAQVGVELPGELQHRLVRLRPAVAEEGAARPGRHREQRLGELDLRAGCSSGSRRATACGPAPRARARAPGGSARARSPPRRRGSPGTRSRPRPRRRTPSPRTSATVLPVVRREDLAGPARRSDSLSVIPRL